MRLVFDDEGVSLQTPSARTVFGANAAGVVSILGDEAGAIPESSPVQGLGLTNNFSSGESENDLWNTYVGGCGFRFYQKTGASSARLLASLTGGGSASFAAIDATPVGVEAPSSGAFTTVTAKTITAAAGVVTSASTVAGLPVSPVAGQRGFVTDAAACAFNATVRGGGAAACPVVFDGTAWVAG